MQKKIQEAVKKHISLGVMLAGAAIQLMSSIVLYDFLNHREYTLYGLIITYISIVFSFGLLGIEQTFLRLSKITKENIFICKRTTRLLFFSFLLGPLILALTFSKIWISFSFIELYALGFLSSLTMFMYNYNRLKSRFFESQMLNNSWRISLAIPVLLAFASNSSYKVVYFSLLTSIIISISISLYLFIRYRRDLLIFKRKENKDTLQTCISFIFSMGILTCIGFLDRIIVGYQFPEEDFARYFFILNIFLSPFAILSSYIGFKSLVKFKKSFKIKSLNKEILKLLMASSCLSILFVFITLKADSFFKIGYELINETSLLIPFVMLGITKLVYSKLSAAMGAIGKYKYILYANIFSLTIVIFSLTMIFLSDDISLERIAWYMVLIWTSRSTFYYISILHQSKWLYHKRDSNAY